MAHFNALQEKDAVVVVVDGRRALELGWKSARESCEMFGRQLREGASGEVWLKVGAARIAFRRVPALPEQAEDMLLCIVNGALCFDAPLSVARQIWTLFTGAARLAEEWAHAGQIAADAAILARTGAPIGLTSHPAIQAEAKKIAEGDSNLRRYIPQASPNAAVRGMPRVFHDTRTPEERFRALLAKSTQAQRQQLLAQLVTH